MAGAEKSVAYSGSRADISVSIHVSRRPKRLVLMRRQRTRATRRVANIDHNCDADQPPLNEQNKTPVAAANFHRRNAPMSPATNHIGNEHVAASTAQ